MVKRLLSITIVAFMALVSVQAQQLQRDPARASFRSAQHALTSTKKAASLEGTTTFGYATGDAWGGLGIGATGTAFDVAIFIPGGALTGATVQGVNIPVLDTKMTNVTAWVRSELGGTNLGEGTKTGPFVSNQYLAVPLDEAVEIPESGVYVGYSFVCSITYPIAYDYYSGLVPNSMYLQYNGSGWGDYSDQFPPLALQAFLAGIELPDYSIDIVSVGQSAQVANSSYSIPVSFNSNSAKSISSLDIDVTVDGKTESQHVKLSSPVDAGIMQSGSFKLNGTSPDKVGRFDLTFAVKKVNDVDYDDEATGNGVLKNLTRLVARRTVIEEFTGTGCGWCPRGWAGMEYMKETYPENFIGIAFHKYNSTDPMYYAPYPTLGMTGAPACVIDRKEEADPYYGNTDEILGIETDFERLNAEAPEVDVEVNAQWNEDETSVDITTDVEFLITPGKVSLVYVLTADSLKGTTTAWRQSNYYASNYTKEQLAGSYILEEFGQGGAYGSSSVYLTFNDAVISSSYNANGVNQGQSLSSADGYEAGSTYSASYTVAGPTKTTVKSALRKDLVTAIVLVVDDTTGEILNAGKVRVSEPTAVKSVSTDNQATPTARYNAAGMRLATPQRGLNLIRMSDGSVRKVLVK